MTPDQIHALGLKEVARITAEFDKVRQEIGFKGDLHAFFDYMRTSPRFAPKSREQLQSDFYRIKRAVVMAERCERAVDPGARLRCQRGILRRLVAVEAIRKAAAVRGRGNRTVAAETGPDHGHRHRRQEAAPLSFPRPADIR